MRVSYYLAGPNLLRTSRGMAALGQCYAPCHSSGSWCKNGQVAVPCPPAPTPAPAPAPAPAPVVTPAPVATPTIQAVQVPATTSTPAPATYAATPSPVDRIVETVRSVLVPQASVVTATAPAAAPAIAAAPTSGLGGIPYLYWILGAGGFLALAFLVTRRDRRRRRKVAA